MYCELGYGKFLVQVQEDKTAPLKGSDTSMQEVFNTVDVKESQKVGFVCQLLFYEFRLLRCSAVVRHS